MRVFFPTSGSARTSLALAVNRLTQYNTQLLMTERDTEIVSDIVRDISRLNDIIVNYIGFGSISAADVAHIVERTNAAGLWVYEQEQDFVRAMVHNVIGTKVIWWDRKEDTWNVNMSDNDDIPSFEGNLFDALNFVGNKYNG